MWTEYLELLKEHGVNVDTDEELTKLANTEKPDINPLTACAYRVCYPSHWLPPPKFVLYTEYQMVDKKYIPYKRMSHFREHLNRLTYSQFVNIETDIWLLTCHCLSNSPLNEDTYNVLKTRLKKEKKQKYYEHIHHLISKFTKTYLDISYDDRILLCDIFLSLERQFKNEQKDRKRHNMFSYYITLQLLLFLLHYHTYYKLPSLKDIRKQQLYYNTLLNYLASNQNFEHIMYVYEKRRANCPTCLTNSDIAFDNQLKKRLL